MDIRALDDLFRLSPLTSASKNSLKEIEIGAHDALYALYGSDADAFTARNRALFEHI